MGSKNRKARKLPEPADDFDRELLANVKEYGWHVMGVKEDEQGPAFAYSIGMYQTLDRPEVIIFGLAFDVMHPLINGIGQQIRAGNRFDDLDEAEDIVEGYNVMFRSVLLRHYQEYFGYARWFYQGDDFPVLQCVWPDGQHRYPWHPECPEAIKKRQPVLWEEQSWPFHEGKNRATITTKPVLQGHPVLLVSHDPDGDWQFLCGTTNRVEDGQVVSLGGILKQDSTLAELSDLPEGWRASRKKPGARWNREKIDERE